MCPLYDPFGVDVPLNCDICYVYLAKMTFSKQPMSMVKVPFSRQPLATVDPLVAVYHIDLAPLTPIAND